MLKKSTMALRFGEGCKLHVQLQPGKRRATGNYSGHRVQFSGFRKTVTTAALFDEPLVCDL
jgi:hypothetical protein